MTTISDEGMPIRFQRVPGRKAIAASDDYSVLGVFKDGYQPHQYEDWLLNNVAKILDDNLSISSAGLLRNRAVAWVEVSVPDNITTPEGVVFRPNLLPPHRSMARWRPPSSGPSPRPFATTP
jgi:hypothetical protein